MSQILPDTYYRRSDGSLLYVKEVLVPGTQVLYCTTTGWSLDGYVYDLDLTPVHNTVLATATVPFTPGPQPVVGKTYLHSSNGWVEVIGLTSVMVTIENKPSERRVRVQYKHADQNFLWTQDLDEWLARVTCVEPRPSWDDYFIQVSHLIATRATCDRKHVGAVLVRDRHIIATGYNGSAPGDPHCDDAGHDLVQLIDGKMNCVRTIHAEANAILQAAKHGSSTQGTTIYTNTYPCWPCAKMILGAGIVEVVVDADYNNDPRVAAAFESKGVAVRRYKKK